MLLLAVGAFAQEAQVRPAVRGADPRSLRPLVIAVEAGWNSLAGVGLLAAAHVHPQLSIEAGLGVSLLGPKAGVRARYNFSRAEWTPFLGAGFLYAAGTTGSTSSFRYSIAASPFLQLVGGVEYQSWEGSSLCAAAGYARLLAHNLDVVSGNPSNSDLDSLRLQTGSGPVLSLSFGRAF